LIKFNGEILMEILGLRASAQEIRYAILKKDSDGRIVFSNQTSENRLRYPANIGNTPEKLF
jgi:hypothetical protein